MAKYRKKPVVIDAFKWSGSNNAEKFPQWLQDAIDNDIVGYTKLKTVQMHIETLERSITAQPGDYIIMGIKGEIYPCKPDIFEQTYDKV